MTIVLRPTYIQGSKKEVRRYRFHTEGRSLDLSDYVGTGLFLGIGNTHDFFKTKKELSRLLRKERKNPDLSWRIERLEKIIWRAENLLNYGTATNISFALSRLIEDSSDEELFVMESFEEDGETVTITANGYRRK